MRTNPAAVVIDSNVLLKTVLKEVYSPQVIQWLGRTENRITCHAPSWIYLECAHTLQKASRRFPDAYTPQQLVTDYQRLKLVDIALYAFEPYTDRAVLLAQQYGVGVYDGIFLALAEALHLPLLTDDQRLIACMAGDPAIELLAASEYFSR